MDLAKQLVDETDKNNVFLIQMNEVSYAHYLIKDSIGQFTQEFDLISVLPSASVRGMQWFVPFFVSML